MPTNVVDRNSDLVRKKWMREGLITKASESIFAPFMGNSKESIVYQANNSNAGDGHTVVFDYDGNLRNRAIKGKDTAYGKGEQKKKFSDKITVERYRLVVDNGDEFDAVDVDNLATAQHGDSRSKLGDLFIRFKDQSLIDAAQGNLGTTPSHIIDLTATFDIAALTDIETKLKTGTGFDTGSTRRPPMPFKTMDGKKMWLFAVDAAMAAVLKKSSGYQSLVYNGDVRGNDNRAISGIIGKLGNLIIVEWDNFFGETDAGTWGLNGSDIELAGLRQYDSVNTAWTGQADFDYASTLRSRGVIMGAGALQMAFGKQPDYKFQESNDFGIKSESAVEFWMDAKKTRLLAENTDYAAAVVAGIDYGVIAVDLTVQA